MEIAELFGGSSSGKMRACLLLVSLVYVQFACCAEVGDLQEFAKHPADEPAWFDISPLDDHDIHMLSKIATNYAAEANQMQRLDDQERERERIQRVRAAEEKQKIMSKPPVDPETTSAELAKLQQKLAMKLSELDDCHAKLRSCIGNSDVKRTAESKDGHHLPPAPPKSKLLGEAPDANTDTAKDGNDKAEDGEDIVYPTTTAKEDWDQNHKGQAPYKHVWRHKPGEPIVQEKRTAVEEYEHVQSGEGFQAFDHEPGYKFGHDRVFEDDVKEMKAAGLLLKHDAEKALKATTNNDNTTMTDQNQKVVEAEKSVRVAEAQIAATKKVPLVSEEQKALVNAEENLKVCNKKLDSQQCKKREALIIN